MAGFVKTFGVTFDYALNGISFANVIMYDRVLPAYIPKDRNGSGGETGTRDNPIRADDPKNRDMVKAIIGGYKF